MSGESKPNLVFQGFGNHINSDIKTSWEVGYLLKFVKPLVGNILYLDIDNLDQVNDGDHVITPLIGPSGIGQEDISSQTGIILLGLNKVLIELDYKKEVA